jgi:hypothetical protein
MKNGKCKLHGGKSTGATSPEGKKRVAEATRKRMLNGQQKLALWRPGKQKNSGEAAWVLMNYCRSPNLGSAKLIPLSPRKKQMPP